MLAAESGATGVFNVAGWKRVSVMELAGFIAKECGVKLKVEHLPARAGDVRDSLADISKAKRDLGYEPEYNLERGLKETVKWFKTRSLQ